MGWFGGANRRLLLEKVMELFGQHAQINTALAPLATMLTMCLAPLYELEQLKRRTVHINMHGVLMEVDGHRVAKREDST